MVYDFKVSDASKHVWSMFIVNNNTCHSVNVTSPSGAVYHFLWCDGELVEISARHKRLRTDGEYYENSSSFREVVSLVPMWLLDKMCLYYNVHVAE